MTVGAVTVIRAEVIIWLHISPTMVEPLVIVPLAAIYPDPPPIPLVAVSTPYPAALVEGPCVATGEDAVIIFSLAVN